MEALAHGITAPSAVYEIAGRRYEIGSRGFAEAVADAHAAHQRPRCMCLLDGVEMYVARINGARGGYILKRMPNTGSLHAPDCPSYEPPAGFSGLGQVLGSAITEDPTTGETTLRLDFPLSRPGRSRSPPQGSDSINVTSDGTRLSLRGLLHYLWDQAELTRWHPAFAGRRTWATVRRHLLQAAEHKIARGEAIRSRLYVPEPFSVDEREAINARRIAQWQCATAAPGKPQQLMLLIGEVKEILPSRYGFKAIVKHMPDQAFAIDEQLYRRLERHFEPELALWGTADDLHMIMIATFSVSGTGIATINELCLMSVTRQWLPVEDGYEKQLLDRLVNDQRSFVKGLHYNLGRGHPIATAMLTDCDQSAIGLFILSGSLDASTLDRELRLPDRPVWIWDSMREPMPSLPPPTPRLERQTSIHQTKSG